LLTEGSYVSALWVYSLAAVAALVLFNYWFLARWPLWSRVLISLPMGAVLLTPALINPGAETFAPALIVVAFQWLSQGQEAAVHALRPLGLFTGIALVLAMPLAVLAAKLQKRRDQPKPELDLST